MKESSIRLFGRSVTREIAQKLLKQHHEAFAQSACKACPGLCCKDCASSDGYLYRDDMSDLEIEELKAAYRFSNRTGFKGPSGCRLPVAKRSTTCVSFYCEELAGQNQFAKEILRERKETVGHIPELDVFEVSEKVSVLLDSMREEFS